MSDDTRTDPPPADPPADPPEGGGLEARVDKIEGRLDQILAALKPGGKPQAADPPADMQAAAQAEVRKLKEAEDAERKAKGEADWRANVDEAIKRIPEKAPDEPMTWKRRAQGALFGKP